MGLLQAWPKESSLTGWLWVHVNITWFGGAPIPSPSPRLGFFSIHPPRSPSLTELVLLQDLSFAPKFGSTFYPFRVRESQNIRISNPCCMCSVNVQMTPLLLIIWCLICQSLIYYYYYYIYVCTFLFPGMDFELRLWDFLSAVSSVVSVYLPIMGVLLKLQLLYSLPWSMETFAIMFYYKRKRAAVEKIGPLWNSDELDGNWWVISIREMERLVLMSFFLPCCLPIPRWPAFAFHSLDCQNCNKYTQNKNFLYHHFGSRSDIRSKASHAQTNMCPVPIWN